MNKLKTLAKTTRLSNREIVNQSMTNVQNAVAATIPSTTQMCQTINRVRKDPDAPKNPTKLSELVFSKKYSETESGKNFIVHDTYDDDDTGDRLIIFGTRDNLDFLLRCDGLFMDGTFGISPPLFHQVYTIHGESMSYGNYQHELNSSKSTNKYTYLFVKYISL